jgi:hypothetical protein
MSDVSWRFASNLVGGALENCCEPIRKQRACLIILRENLVMEPHMERDCWREIPL